MSPDPAQTATRPLAVPALAWRDCEPSAAPGVRAVHVWLVDTSDPVATEAGWQVLEDRERQRALRYRDERAARGFVAARGALRSILAGYVGREAARIPLLQEAGGRPRLGAGMPALAFSVSRTAGASLVAVQDCGRIGVDLERVSAVAAGGRPPWEAMRAHAPPGLLDELRPEADAEAFCLAWTRVEAYAKAVTNGLGGTPADAATWHARSFRVGDDLVGALAGDGLAARVLSAYRWRARA